MGPRRGQRRGSRRHLRGVRGRGDGHSSSCHACRGRRAYGHALAMDRCRPLPRRLRTASRRAVARDGADRHRRRRAYPSLLRRLHGARRGLRALLHLPEPVRALDAHPGARRQPAADVHRMGGRRPVLLPANFVLVHQPQIRLQRPQGLRRQSHRRRGLSARDVHDRRDARRAWRLDARLRRAARQRTR